MDFYHEQHVSLWPLRDYENATRVSLVEAKEEDIMSRQDASDPILPTDIV